jgi:hypothetical protein
MGLHGGGDRGGGIPLPRCDCRHGPQFQGCLRDESPHTKPSRARESGKSSHYSPTGEGDPLPHPPHMIAREWSCSQVRPPMQFFSAAITKRCVNPDPDSICGQIRNMLPKSTGPAESFAMPCGAHALREKQQLASENKDENERPPAYRRPPVLRMNRY